MISRIAARVLRALWVTGQASPALRRLVPWRLRRIVRHALMARAVRGSPDRVFLERSIIPNLLTRHFPRVLSVGVEQYTRHHPRAFSTTGTELWTIDIDPYHARWGAPAGRHVVGDVCELGRHFAPMSFDAVIFNGVIGFGVDDEASADASIVNIASTMKPGGLLVLGWNVGRGVDPTHLAALGTLFRRADDTAVPSHVEIPHSTHVFEHLVRTDAAATPAVRGPGGASSSGARV